MISSMPDSRPPTEKRDRSPEQKISDQARGQVVGDDPRPAGKFSVKIPYGKGFGNIQNPEN
jgi:hypothetical protein